MRNHPILITDRDASRLRGLLASRAGADRDAEHLQELAVELERAYALKPGELPSDVIRMHSRIQVLDLMSGERRHLQLVFPKEADITAQRISVLAPLGTALLGYRQGDEVEWLMPGGLRRLLVEKVCQPIDSECAAADGPFVAAAS